MQQEPDALETQKVDTTPAETPRERLQNSNLMPSDVPEWVHLNDGNYNGRPSSEATV
jgi:hypothetical protein